MSSLFELTFKNTPNIKHGVTFKTISENIVQINGKSLPKNTSGFYLSRIDKKDNWDYTDYTTIYRIIDGNTVQFSNDGSIWIEPIKKVTVLVKWNDVNNFDEIRPNQISANIRIGDKMREVCFCAQSGWKHTFDVKETETLKIFEIEEVADYTFNHTDTIIIYTHEVEKKEDLEPRVIELEENNLSNQLVIDELLTDIIPMQQDEVAILAESIDTILTEIIPEIIESLIPPNDEEELLDVEEENFNEEALFSKKKGK